jgi:uncharacterized SAM-binding protein YcdF (DUF218 family)
MYIPERRRLDARRWKRRRRLGALLAVLTAALLLLRAMRTKDDAAEKYDAVVVPGGGLDADGKPLPWVAARLDAALKYDQHTTFYLVLSRGTTHKPPPRDSDGYAIDEAAASATYLVERGVPTSKVLLESWSLDTIGNAAFARMFHAELKGWRRLLIVTTSVHLARTRAIFDWVFRLGPQRYAPPQLDYESVDDSAVMTEQQRTSRALKEEESLVQLRETAARVTDLSALHSFLFVEHGAYRARTFDGKLVDKAHGSLLTTY